MFVKLICFFLLPLPPTPPPRQLISHLKVFAKFTNPRSLYLEPRLNELYHQVTGKDPSPIYRPCSPPPDAVCLSLLQMLSVCLSS